MNLCLVLALLAVVPVSAAAQSRPSVGRYEISGAIGWAGSAKLGTEKATLQGNGVPSGSPVVLFETTSTVESGLTLEGRLAVRLTRMFSIEGTGGITRNDLQTRVSGDLEGAAPVTLTEPLRQFTIEAGLLAHLHKLAWAGGRVVPFVTGGAGYLRQLHDGRTLATNGASGYAGGGIKYVWIERSGGWVKGVGLRADARVRLHSGGFDTGDDRVRVHPHVSGGAYFRF